MSTSPMISRFINLSLFLLHSYTFYRANQIFTILAEEKIIETHPDVPHILTLLTILGVIFNIIYRFSKAFLNLSDEKNDILWAGYAAPSSGFIGLVFWSMELAMPGLIMRWGIFKNQSKVDHILLNPSILLYAYLVQKHPFLHDRISSPLLLKSRQP